MKCGLVAISQKKKIDYKNARKKIALMIPGNHFKIENWTCSHGFRRQVPIELSFLMSKLSKSTGRGIPDPLGRSYFNVEMGGGGLLHMSMFGQTHGIIKLKIEHVYTVSDGNGRLNCLS